ncbi:fibrobacter succinogenes major paralogous domain-containing protein [candidate division KSB1 bacterium]|nr:fibrobacter succinogenes major paralogous domain-containing protein [candidate division KSB1 bacterium]
MEKYAFIDKVFFIFFLLSILLTCGKNPDEPEKETDNTNPKAETGTLTDIDGNVYKTVRIGEQWWTAENLKVTHYRNGDAIPKVTDSTEWINLTTGAFCYYDNDSNKAAVYGALYNWYVINDSRNIVPVGWNVPRDEDWKQLEIFLGMSPIVADSTGWRGTNEGGKMKETGTTHWNSLNEGATNESGFTALPAGYLNSNNHVFNDMGNSTLFWSATEVQDVRAWFRLLGYYNAYINRSHSHKRHGLSVRLVKGIDIPH